MKFLYTVLFLAMSFLPSAEQDELRTIEVTYDGQGEGYFYFVDIEGCSYAFWAIEPEARVKYNLTNESCEGRRFTVKYRSVYETSEDKDDENDYGKFIIVSLQLME